MSDLVEEIKNPKRYFVKLVFNKYMVKWKNKLAFTSYIILTCVILFTAIYCSYNLYLSKGFDIPFIACSIFMFSGFFIWLSVLHGYFKSFYSVAKPLIDQYLNLRKQYLNNERDSGFLIWYYVNNNSFIKQKFCPTFSTYLANCKDFDAQNGEGDTLLHLIIRDNPDSPYIAELLLLGSDPFIPNKKGITASDSLPANRKYLVVNIEKNRLSTAVQKPIAPNIVKRI